MEDIWERLRILHASKKELLMLLGEKRYALTQFGREVEKTVAELDAIDAALQVTIAELEKQKNISGETYTLDIDKQEIIYGSTPNRSDS